MLSDITGSAVRHGWNAQQAWSDYLDALTTGGEASPKVTERAQLIAELSVRITGDFGPGYSVQSLYYSKQFYLSYPQLLEGMKILHAVRGKSSSRAASGKRIFHATRGKTAWPAVSSDVSEVAWRPGRLHFNLSWTHYRTLLRVGKSAAQSFYEIEAIKNNWSGRELERQINSLLYERLALSKDKKGLLRLATKDQEVLRTTDAFKDPLVIEFMGLPESPKLVESKVEQGLIDNLQEFLLELGKGFAFVRRQERLTLDGDHFYVDLVFYHTILKCYILLEIKTGKLTHEALGQLQLKNTRVIEAPLSRLNETSQEFGGRRPPIPGQHTCAPP